MEVEYGEEAAAAMTAAAEAEAEAAPEEGWETPRREECRIPVEPPCPPPPPRKKAVAMPELVGGGGKRRAPPKGGYFEPPDLEALFSKLAPQRRRTASSCA